MTITFQYKIFNAAQGNAQTVAVKRDIADLLQEAGKGGPANPAASHSPVPPKTTVSGLLPLHQPQLPQLSGQQHTPLPSVTATQQPLQPVASMLDPNALEPPQLTVAAPIPTGGLTTNPPNAVATVQMPPLSLPPPPSTASASVDDCASMLGSTSSIEYVPAKLPPIPVPLEGPDPAKETRTELTPSGCKFEVPTVVTGGYDLDNLMCTICNNRVFKNDKTLMGHMLNHFGVTPKMANCPICGLTLQKKSYARHLRLHGNAVPKDCPYCKEEFKDKKTLEKHIHTFHEAERPYICEHCPETFRTALEQNDHIVIHRQPNSPFKCDECEMTFLKQEHLNTHWRTHTGEKPFVCEICEKAFHSEQNKRIHVLKHQGSLPFRCEVCGVTFQSIQHLNKHSLSHTRKTEVVSAKINSFLEDFSASLENDMIGLEDTDFSEQHDVGFNQDQKVVSLPDDISLEAAAAEAAIMFGQNDFGDDLLNDTGDFTIEEEEDDEGEEETAEPKSAGESSLHCSLCSAVLKNKRSYVFHMKRHAGLLKFKCKLCPKSFQV